MKAFELHFNPKKRDDLLLASFIYIPANIYENRLGNLCVVGELTQAMPQNTHFLTSLSSVIKKEYYSSGLKKSCEASLQEALKKGNEFLDQESRNGNVGWLGNLNFGVISFKDSVLNFAKVGDVKIFLVRANELMDISQDLENVLCHPDPLKVFGSMAGGKLSNEDKIIVLNKRILRDLGKKQKFLGELAKASNEKELKRVLKIHQEPLAGISGICLILMADGKDWSGQTVTLQNDLPSFSLFYSLFKPFMRFFVKVRKRPQIKINFPRLKVLKISLPRLTKPSLPKLPKINLMAAQKKIFLVLGLILVLLAFYYIFRGERVQELRDAQSKLTEAQSKAMLAEGLLILEEDDRARALFKETLDILSPLTKRGSPLRDDALFLQNSIKQFLK
ncbi:MAG: hypothetical protein ABIG29_01570 [Candidatus Nealsonbacteria bacterium]